MKRPRRNHEISGMSAPAGAWHSVSADPPEGPRPPRQMIVDRWPRHSVVSDPLSFSGLVGHGRIHEISGMSWRACARHSRCWTARILTDGAYVTRRWRTVEIVTATTRT